MNLSKNIQLLAMELEVKTCSDSKESSFQILCNYSITLYDKE
jgi:hypothetical protein